MKIAQRVAVTTAALTLVLVAVGVLVRATGSGLGCPDWPLCHGGVVPPGDQGHQPLIEFSHRFLAAAVGLLVIATAVLAWIHFRGVASVIVPSFLAVPMVGFQGVLGAITVWRELPPEIVATHLLTAMIVLSLEAATVVAMYTADPERSSWKSIVSRPASQRAFIWSAAALGWFAVTLWLGGYMAESGASTACGDEWPLCNGGVIPAADDHEFVHMFHRYFAAGLVLLLIPLLLQLWRHRDVLWGAGALAAVIGALYLAQVTVGAFNVVFTFPDTLTILHTTIAGALWFAISLAAFAYLFDPVPVAETQQARLNEAPA